MATSMFAPKTKALDWERILAIDVDRLARQSPDSNELEVLEDVYALLSSSSVSPDDSQCEDPEAMVHLFRVMQLIAEMRTFRMDEAYIELDKVDAELKKERAIKTSNGAVDGDTTTVKELEEDIVYLERELQVRNAHIADLETRGSSGITLDELQAAEKKVNDLRKEMQHTETSLHHEREATGQAQVELREAKLKLFDMEREMDRMRQDIQDYQTKIQTDRERVRLRKGEDDEYRGLMKHKNIELDKYLREIQQLHQRNEELEEEVEHLTLDLEAAVTEIEKSANSYTEMKQALAQNDQALLEMERDRDIYQGQVADLSAQVQAKGNADVKILQSLNVKIEEWQQRLGEKDRELQLAQVTIQQRENEIRDLRKDLEESTVHLLRKQMSEKEAEIALLHQQLVEATALLENASGDNRHLKDTLFPLREMQGGNKRLQKDMEGLQEQLSESRKRVKKAENAAASKDEDLIAALARMQEYERGTYGLYDAVQEIKDLKARIQIRDGDIQGFSKSINKLESQVDDLLEENEELRRRLGISDDDVVNVDALRNAKTLELEQLRAVNRTLNAEVERLEEERLDMKRKLRLQAMHRGGRAVELGLTAEDLEAVEEYADHLRSGPGLNTTMNYNNPGNRIGLASIGDVPLTGSFNKGVDALRVQVMRLSQDLEQMTRKLEETEKERDGMRANMKTSREENDQLHHIVKEIQISMRRGSRKAELLSIDRLLAVWEHRHIADGDGVALMHKAELEQLRGVNSELRRTVENLQNQMKEQGLEIARSSVVVGNLEKELDDVKALPPPTTSLIPSSALTTAYNSPDVTSLASLTDQLVQCLRELELKDQQLRQVDTSLESFRAKYAVLVHQQGLVYAEHFESRKNWRQVREDLEKQIDALKDTARLDGVRLHEFDTLLKELEASPDDYKRTLGDLSRKVTVMKVNEKALSRRFNALEERESILRKEVDRQRTDLSGMERTLRERVGYLTRYKEAADNRVHMLLSQLENSAPAAVLEATQDSYLMLADRMRVILEHERRLLARHTENEELNRQLLHSRLQISEFERKLATVTEAKQGAERRASESSLNAVDGGLVARRIETLEEKECNERERADLAMQRLEAERQGSKALEERCKDVEARLSEMQALTIGYQDAEKQLRDEMARAKEHALEVTRAAVLEKSDLELEVAKLKEVSDVATTQMAVLTANQSFKEKELEALRHAVLELQQQSDQNAVMGKLHHHLIALQVSEGTAVRKWEKSCERITVLEASLIRLERQRDDKECRLYDFRNGMRAKLRSCHHTIESLRRRCAGSIPLDRQEDFSRRLRDTEELRCSLSGELAEVSARRLDLIDELEQVKLDLDLRDDLITSLRSGDGASKVIEWHSKISDIKLESLRLARQVARLEDTNRTLETASLTHEATVTSMEKEGVALEQSWEQRQIEWEAREGELLRMVHDLEAEKEDVSRGIQALEEEDPLPDPTLPLPLQLEYALRRLRDRSKAIYESRINLQQVKADLDAANKVRVEAEEALSVKDKALTQARLELAASQDQREVDLAGEQVQHTRQMAFASMSALQSLLQQKESSLEKYQEMLTEVREARECDHENYQKELRIMNERLAQQSEEATRKVRDASISAIHKPPAISHDDTDRMNQLEDAVAEQENEIATLTSQIATFERQAISLREEAANALRAKTLNEREATRAWEESSARIAESDAARESVRANLQMNLDNVKEVLERREEELRLCTAELQEMRRVSTESPAKATQALVKSLKNQLTLKDKQQAALTKAIVHLKSEVLSAQEKYENERNCSTNADHLKGATSSDATAILQRKVEKLQGRLARLKDEAREQKERESMAIKELERLRERSEARAEHGNVSDDTIRRLQTVLKEHQRNEQKLELEVKALQSRIDNNQDVSDLEKKVRVLQAKVNNKSTTLPSTLPSNRSVTEVSRWESDKKWQKKCDLLRTRLEQKSHDYDELTKQHQLTRSALDRLQRANGKNGNLRSSNDTSSTSDTPSMRKLREDLYSMRMQVFELQDEVKSCRRELDVDRANEIRALTEVNRVLQDNVAKLEEQLQSSGDESAEEARKLRDTNLLLRQEVLRAESRSVELEFDRDAAAVEIPRLTNRIEELNEYVHSLKSSGAEDTNLRRTQGVGGRSSATQVSNSSDFNVEAMRGVIQRLQKENTLLKRASNSTKYIELSKENKRLHEEISLAAESRDAELALGKQSTKLVALNEKLQRQLEKKTVLITELERKLSKNDKAETDESTPSIKHLEDTICRYEREAFEAKRIIRDLREQLNEKQPEYKQMELESKLEYYERAIAEGRTIGEMADELRAAQRKLSKAYANERDALRRAERAETRLGGVCSADGQRRIPDEMETHVEENRRLKQELEAFDPAFFDEIEDLKYNYKEASELNTRYQKKMRQLSKQFGVTIDV